MKLQSLLPEDLVFGEPASFGGIGMIPLLRATDPKLPAIALLDEALLHGSASITEVDESGEVSLLVAENKGERLVLILEGEELIGGKQNRIVNTTVVVLPEATVQIPVSCVEAHRWSRQRSDFRSSNALFRARSRVIHKTSVTENLKHRSSFSSDQSAVWGEVGMTLSELGAASPTADFQVGREKVTNRIEDFVSAFRPVKRQIGAAFVSRQGVLGCEWLASSELFERAFKKIARSFAFEALAPRESEIVSSGALLSWWKMLVVTEFTRRESPGDGEDIRVESGDTVGSGLLWEGGLLHFSCFSRDAGYDEQSKLLARRSRASERLGRGEDLE